MDATNATSTTSSTTSGKSAASSKLFGNYEAFLQLLTTQLQNQDPLDPMDASEYTSQLVQYAGVEQQIETNDYLSSLISSTTANSNTMALSYIGNVVQVDDANAHFDGTEAVWSVDLDSAASNVKLTITDGSDNVVRTIETSGNAGTNLISWDGTTGSGGTADAGTYTLSVSAADDDNATVRSSISSYGLVTGVDTSGDTALLNISGLKVPVSDVMTVTSAQSS